MLLIEKIKTLADQSGLVMRGGFNTDSNDNVPDISRDKPSRSLILFGNAGSSIWPVFSISPEFSDKEIDPLNRWSERVGQEMANQLDGLALFPFIGPPYQPFVPWAKKAESLLNSKLGMLMHPKYGLWHAYRFAIAFSQKIEALSERPIEADICANCVDQPCLNVCPVSAFSNEGYDVASCYEFLKINPESSCRTQTCKARRACPEGQNFKYSPSHARFHIDAFYSNIEARFDSSN